MPHTQVQELIKRALLFGNKSANLQELMQLCTYLKPLKATVPPAHFLSHDAISEHLTRHAPQWHLLWQQFVEQQDLETGELKKDALDTLSQIRSLVIEVFATIPFDDFGEFLEDTQAPLMVRSTGIEDTVDVANPGGNESLSAVKPNPSDVSHAIGVVVASYFSEKSLKQRLLSQASNITAEPFIPVLLQHMISEAMDADGHDVVRSGVMYTHDFETRIQMAPGHGELIVNSKGPFDTFIVSEQNIIYSEIQQKPIRLVPQEVTDEGRVVRELIIKENTPSLKKDACIRPGVAIRIAQVGRAIHEHYGMPMDVEFVYNPKDDEIALVQARPIPRGDLAHIKPSSIPPSTMLKLKNQNILPIECMVITPAVSNDTTTFA